MDLMLDMVMGILLMVVLVLVVMLVMIMLVHDFGVGYVGE